MTKDGRDATYIGTLPGLRFIPLGLVFLVLALLVVRPVPAAEAGQTITTGGLSIFYGLLPAALLKGRADETMHGGVNGNRHQVHLVVAIFDSASGSRVTDATVEAQIAEFGLGGKSDALRPMSLAGAVTYGAFFRLTDANRYMITLKIRRPGQSSAIIARFQYGHALP